MSEPRPRRLGPGTIALRLHILQAGESITIDYIFSLPPALEDFRLRIAPGGWSGDLLEWLFFGRKEFQLR